MATYRLFCRAADRPNAKARMADTNYPGTGQQVGDCFHFLTLYISFSHADSREFYQTG